MAEIYLGGGNDYYAVTSTTGQHIRAQNGSDTLLGGIGNDTLRGGGGNDIIYDSEGNDRMFLGDGNDLFHSSRFAGNDTVTGDQGRDGFTFGSARQTPDPDHTTTITDFVFGEDYLLFTLDEGSDSVAVWDVSDLAAFDARDDASIYRSGDDLVLQTDESGDVILQGQGFVFDLI